MHPSRDLATLAARARWLPVVSTVFSSLVSIACLAIAAGAEEWSFTDVTASAGVDYEHGFTLPAEGGALFMAGGVAAGDYDGDGWVDLYVLRGELGANVLLRNRGDGTFEDRAAAAGVDVSGHLGNGAGFADLDGDGWLDLVIGGIEENPVLFFRNRGPGPGGEVTFEDVSDRSGLPIFLRTFGPSFGDFDLDGDLDLFLPQWTRVPVDQLWRNEGDFAFTSASAALEVDAWDAVLHSFTPIFADVDFDGWPDVVVTGDFDNSQVLLNNGPSGGLSDGPSEAAGDVSFRLATDETVVIDQNGMGAAVGDYDNDGHLDWFVSSIFNEGTHPVGNRLYRGRGDGTFDDVTEAAGVIHGFWGWGSCFSDFDNDGFLDILHVNGWAESPFANDPTRLFMNDGDGTFTETAAARGIVDARQGRGVACFDYDRDGDVDVFIANNSHSPRLYRNDGGNAAPWIAVRLRGEAPNTRGIGARILLRARGQVLTREIRASSNYVSQNPSQAHFGLDVAQAADEILVVWPGGRLSSVDYVAAGQELTIEASLIMASGFESGNLNGWDNPE